jgi:three-Cys-motif partner protein
VSKRQEQFDEIGSWSEVKLDILREYATAYSKILAVQQKPKLEHFYIDGFAGAGVHISKATGEFVAGSPLNALNIQPPFKRYFFVDLNERRVDQIRALIGDRNDVVLKQGDCNRVLVDEVFPEVRWDHYRRALCLLDPYGMHLDWKVIEAAGKSKTIDLFLNFPIMDINMNALRKKGW